MDEKRCRYICFTGPEGTGKTTQTQKLVDYLIQQGYSVLKTKEPGVNLLPLTMELRKIMLDSQYENQITPVARELISQAIRSIHMDQLIYPAMKSGEYDFIIQDRGIPCGLAYGMACGNDIEWLEDLASNAIGDSIYDLYDTTICLTGDIYHGLNRARSSKQEFEHGDAMEAKGYDFMKQVSTNMHNVCEWFNADIIDIDNKNIDEVFIEILEILDLT